ncbi:MAG: hypothetical protein ACRDTM_17815, partial [Micromonosporaceae bacterium]
RVAIAQFIESDAIYRLVWGMEAARVYEAAQGNPDADALSGSAVTAIETGTFNRSASILIRSGFDHRLAAISAVMSTDATFESAADMRQWIRDLDPALAFSRDWPTPESRSAWEAFAYRARAPLSRKWSRQTEDLQDVTWYDTAPDPGTWLRVTDAEPGKIKIWSTGFDVLGEAAIRLNPERQGVLRARRLRVDTGVQLRYRGPGDLFPGEPKRAKR